MKNKCYNHNRGFFKKTCLGLKGKEKCNMKANKVLGIALVGVLAIGMMSGCGGSKASSNAAASSAATSAASSAAEAAESAASSAAEAAESAASSAAEAAEAASSVAAES